MVRSLGLCLLLAGCAGTDETSLLQARFELGLDRDSVYAAAQAHCAQVETRVYTAVEAAPYASQEQIDCLGYEFSGKQRKLELLVNEGHLGFYWVLIEREELGSLRRRLERAYGPPLCDKPDYVIFKGEGVALRSEPAEVLVSLPEDLRAITGGCP